MKEKYKRIYNDLLLDLESCRTSKRYQDMQELYVEMERLKDIWDGQKTDDSHYIHTYFTSIKEGQTVQLPYEAIYYAKFSVGESLVIRLCEQDDLYSLAVEKAPVYSIISAFCVLPKSEEKYREKIDKNNDIKISLHSMKKLEIVTGDTITITVMEELLTITKYEPPYPLFIRQNP